MSNLVTRVNVISSRASVIIPAGSLSALLNYDPSALGFWSLYDGSLTSKAGVMTLAAQDKVNKTPAFSVQGLLVDSVFQDSYMPLKANGARLFDADMPNGITMLVAFRYQPVNTGIDKNVIIAGNTQGAAAGMGIMTYMNRPAFTVADENAHFGMGTTDLIADWCFAALSYDRASRKVVVYWKQAASGIEQTATYTGNDSTPYVPSTTLPYALGNCSFPSGIHAEKNTVAEFAIYDRSMSMAELIAKYSESQIRLLPRGIKI